MAGNRDLLSISNVKVNRTFCRAPYNDCDTDLKSAISEWHVLKRDHTVLPIYHPRVYEPILQDQDRKEFRSRVVSRLRPRSRALAYISGWWWWGWWGWWRKGPHLDGRVQRSGMTRERKGRGGGRWDFQLQTFNQRLWWSR